MSGNAFVVAEAFNVFKMFKAFNVFKVFRCSCRSHVP